MITQEALYLLREESGFITSPIHGLKHWRTVERNGHYLASFNGADKAVLSYFAYFHDCMRENEGRDKGHGPRAAVFAMKHRDTIPLNDVQFKQLTDACKGHTYGTRPECITINTCWDADRLDLGRVGINPDAEYLHDVEAKRIADEFDFSKLISFTVKDESKQGINKVVFDLDNTLICEKGESVRSGMFELLDSLKANNIDMSIWTASTKARAESIIDRLDLNQYFIDVVYRDDYDPEATWGRSLPKDIRYSNGDLLVDDSKKNIEFVESIGLKGFHITPYISYIDTSLDEIEQLHQVILPKVKFNLKRENQLLKRIKKIFVKKKSIPKWIEC
ncbi:MAG: hypothetical protein HN639_00960 [Candidatus Thioglobus sp.]|nr:hypothetical protein [Candidatus Thioglobus sp.]MBT7498105.1 hypothetical protein [Candidatus Thioglobus sp.]